MTSKLCSACIFQKRKLIVPPINRVFNKNKTNRMILPYRNADRSTLRCILIIWEFCILDLGNGHLHSSNLLNHLDSWKLLPRCIKTTSNNCARILYSLLLQTLMNMFRT